MQFQKLRKSFQPDLKMTTSSMKKKMIVKTTIVASQNISAYLCVPMYCSAARQTPNIEIISSRTRNSCRFSILCEGKIPPVSGISNIS